MRGSIKGAVALAAVLVVAAVGATSADATTAEISKASLSSDGSRITIAGSVTWTGCEIKLPKPPPPLPGPEEAEEIPPPDIGPSHCGWVPFATVGVGDDPAECSLSGREWPEALGPGVMLAWEGSESRNAGTVGFEVADLPISGGSEELVCLGLIERAADFPYHQARSRLLASVVATTEESAPPRPSSFTGSQPSSMQLSHRRHHHHHAKRRHRGVSLSEHVAVSKN